MSIHVTSAVWKRSQATGPARLVLLRLADQANDDGWCWPSQQTIAEDCRLSLASVKRALSTLVELGELTCYRRGKRVVNVYRLLVGTPAVVDVPATLGIAHAAKVTAQPEPSQPSSDSSPEPQVIAHSCEPRTVIEPSGVQVPNGTCTAPRDLLFDAVLEACGWDYTALTPRSRGWVNSALPDLRNLGATPGQVRFKGQVYQATYNRRPTPSALAKHWAALTARSLERVNPRQVDRALARRRIDEQLRRVGS